MMIEGSKPSQEPTKCALKTSWNPPKSISHTRINTKYSPTAFNFNLMSRVSMCMQIFFFFQIFFEIKLSLEILNVSMFETKFEFFTTQLL